MQLIQISEPEMPEVPEIAFGIDLGTTNSLIALATEDRMTIFADNKGRELLPSVVFYNFGSCEAVGYEALTCGEGMSGSSKNKRGDATGVIYSAKRAMGSGFDVGDGVSSIEVSAEILNELAEMVYVAQGLVVEKAVITVPAYFDDAARNATKKAAELAGIEVLRLLNEPTAALLAYGFEVKPSGIYAVYDLGGGTFDISIMRMHQGIFQVLAVNGDTSLGGDDFDLILARMMLQKCSVAPELSSPNDEMSDKITRTLLLHARAVKEDLSTETQAECGLEIEGREVVRFVITRDEYEDAIAPLVSRTVNMVRGAIKGAKISIEDIQELILVGGATRTPLIRAELGKIFAGRLISDVDPDKVVVIGAALQARALTTTNTKKLLIDVLPLSLGIETMGGVVEKIIQRNTPIPVARKQVFTTYVDGQTSIQINVYQGEREMISQNKMLAHFELTNITPMVAGQARVVVEFKVDMDGLLAVSATEEISGVSRTVQVSATYGLSDAEVELCVKDSVDHFNSDMELRELVERSQRILQKVRDFVQSNSDLLTNPEFQLVSGLVSALEKSLLASDLSGIRQSVADLEAEYAALVK